MNSPSLSRTNKPEQRYEKRKRQPSAKQRQLRKQKRQLLSSLKTK